jgi:hypothetical protein
MYIQIISLKFIDLEYEQRSRCDEISYLPSSGELLTHLNILVVTPRLGATD